MARPRLPTSLKVLKGTAQPCRINPDEPKVPTIDRPPPPGDLPESHRRAWIYIVDHLAHLRVLTEGDIPALRLLAGEQAELWEMEADPSDFSPVERSAVRKQIMNMLGRFGMTPSDRSKVSAMPAEQKDRLAKFTSYPGKA